MLVDSGARLVFCENAEQVAKIAEVKHELPELQYVIVIDGHADGALPIEAVRARAREVDPQVVDERVRAVAARGRGHARLHLGHDRSAQGLHADARQLPVGDRDVQRPARAGRRAAGDLHVPAARARARARGADRGARCGRHARLLVWRLHEDRSRRWSAAAPTHFVAVPRIYEKMHTGVISAVESSGPHVRRCSRGRSRWDAERAAAERAGKPLGAPRASAPASGRPPGAGQGAGAVRRAPADGAGRRGADRPTSCWSSSTPAA